MPVITRAALAYLLVTGCVVGAWASVFPLGFYTSFPGFGRAWVAMDGPFNEHLIRDVGAAYLMTAVLAGLGLLRTSIAPPFTVGLATLAFNLPHFAYHMAHLGMYGALDQALNIVALGSAVLASGWLMTPQGQGASRMLRRRG